MGMTETISRDELKAKMDHGDDFFLVEALEERYYRRSHLPGAINLPPRTLDLTEALLPDKEAEIVFYCSDPQ
jgi:rhodanese-related sulfurtransferase